MADTDPTAVAAGAGTAGTEETAAGEREDAEGSAADRAHLDDVADGCGCAEVREHLSEQRGAEEDGAEDGDGGSPTATDGE